jgi:hypothetical protein
LLVSWFSVGFLFICCSDLNLVWLENYSKLNIFKFKHL